MQNIIPRTSDNCDIMMAAERQFYIILFLLLCCTNRSLCMNPHPGHLKPLGHGIKPQDIKRMGRFPAPSVFYQNFVKGSKPLLMQSVLQSIDFPPYRLWSDQYLRDNFGDEKVEVEMGKKENRSSGMKVMSLSRYLDMYKDRNIYMVQDLLESMKGDVTVPVTLQHGGFEKMLQSIVLWLSSGGTKSVLHFDPVDNINCLLDGTKDFLFIDKKYRHLVEADGFVHERSHSKVDVDRVDMNKFPKFQNLTYYSAKLKAGDCVYIPYEWYHQINSGEGRNFALNFWFIHLWWFDFNEGKDANDSYTTKPLNDYPFSSPNEEVRSIILKTFQDEKYVTKNALKSLVDRRYKSDMEEIFSEIDTDENGRLTWQELYSFDIDRILRHYAPAIEQLLPPSHRNPAMKDEHFADDLASDSDTDVSIVLENEIHDEF